MCAIGEESEKENIMNRRRLKFQIIVGVMFVAALVYGISTISLIGHRPVVIFIV